jgi:hypothetical protein
LAGSSGFFTGNPLKPRSCVKNEPAAINPVIVGLQLTLLISDVMVKGCNAARCGISSQALARVFPVRSIVERTFAWLDRSRRLGKGDRGILETAAAHCGATRPSHR